MIDYLESLAKTHPKMTLSRALEKFRVHQKAEELRATMPRRTNGYPTGVDVAKALRSQGWLVDWERMRDVVNYQLDDPDRDPSMPRTTGSGDRPPPPRR